MGRSSRAGKPKLHPALQSLIAAAHSLMQQGATQEAAEKLMAAWQMSNGDLQVLSLCGNAMVEMGERNQAFQLLDDAIKRHGQTEEVSLIMGHLAVRMQLHDIAEKSFQAAISCNPNQPSHYVNLSQAMAKNNRANDAIALLQEIIPMFPDYAMLWNAVGVLVKQYQGKGGLARTFFSQALALAPKETSIIVNLAEGQPPEAAIPLLEQAIEIEPDNSMAHLSLATEYLALGEFAKAWPHYEHRLDCNSGEIRAPRFVTKAKRWKGQPLKDKTILVMAEQGIGDEVFFGMALPRLIADAKQVIISCDARLTDIYKRSFPGTIVTTYEDRIIDGFRYRHFPEIEARKLPLENRIDFSVPLASLASHYWLSPADLPVFSRGYLAPKASLVEKMSETLEPYRGKQLVGLSWRSGLTSGARQFAYLGLDGLKPLLDLENTVFVCLQYGADPEEIAFIREEIGLELITFDEIDLKEDIEANLAIVSNMDLVIGPSTATQMFAMSTGAETSLIAWGRPWWAQQDPNTGKLIHNPKVDLITYRRQDWLPAMTELVDKLQNRDRTKRKQADHD